TFEADVRLAGAGLHDRQHARFRAQDEPGRERARVARKRRKDAVPSVLAPWRESGESGGVREAQPVPRQPDSLLPGETQEHAGWRWNPAGPFDGPLRQPDG